MSTESTPEIPPFDESSLSFEIGVTIAGFPGVPDFSRQVGLVAGHAFDIYKTLSRATSRTVRALGSLVSGRP